MTGTYYNPFRLAAWMVLIIAGLTACEKGPLAPEARLQAQSRDQYLALLQQHLVVDDTFEWNTLSSALIVRLLPYSLNISQAAIDRFGSEPAFQIETANWDRPVGRPNTPPMVFLLGLFTEDLKQGDVAALGRFRPSLKTPDGRILAPAEIKRFGRDQVFIRDHFPVFNPWEDVYLVRFEPPPECSYCIGRLEFRLEWPGGVQTLILNGRY